MEVALPQDPRERSAVLREFAGLWIAVDERQGQEIIIGASDSADGVFRTIDEKHRPEALVSRVPSLRKGLAIGLG
jgi:hypothetical protein